jgi:hypothetical protein
MPRRKLPPFVEVWRDRHGKLRVYFRKGVARASRYPSPSARPSSGKPTGPRSSARRCLTWTAPLVGPHREPSSR